MIYHIMSAGIHRAMIPALSEGDESSETVGAGVEVTTGGGDGGVAEGSLDQVNGRGRGLVVAGITHSTCSRFFQDEAGDVIPTAASASVGRDNGPSSNSNTPKNGDQ